MKLNPGAKPFLLPHYIIKENRLIFLDEEVLQVSPTELAILGQCDGRTPLAAFDGYQRDLERLAEIVRELMARRWVLVFPGEEDCLPPVDDWRGCSPVLVISPHPDDAVFSCGGLMWGIYRRGGKIWIVNVFSRENFSIWSRLRRKPELAEKIIAREEAAVSRVLGSTTVGLGFADAPLRGYTRLRDVFGKIAERDRETLEAVREELQKIITGQRFSLILGPCGIGEHVDHRLVREALLDLRQKRGMHNLAFYEDQPYTAASDGQYHPQMYLKGEGRRWSEVIIDVTAEYEAKMQLCTVYQSQIRPEQMDGITAYAAGIGHSSIGAGYVEKYWNLI